MLPYSSIPRKISGENRKPVSIFYSKSFQDAYFPLLLCKNGPELGIILAEEFTSLFSQYTNFICILSALYLVDQEREETEKNIGNIINSLVECVRILYFA